ncbi:MAG: C25 family cysteine peptidase [Ardenticatenaceae bacterium]|nr:C25 family cysteine peptidase [Ardenticatenaceae bacterium]
MKRRLPALILTLLIAAALAQPIGAAPPATNPPLASASGGLTVTTADDAVTLHLVVPPPAITTVTMAGQTFQRVTVPDYTLEGAPGAPALPLKILTVGVPADQGLRLDVRPLRVEPLTGPIRPAPAPALRPVFAPDAAADPLARPLETRLEPGYDAAAYAHPAWTPETIATIIQAGRFRGQPFAQIAFRPLQVNPATGEARLVREVELRLRFDPAAPLPAAPDPVFEALRSSFLLNAADAARWRLPAVSRAVAAVPQEPTAAEPRWRLTVDHAGIYRIDRAALQAAGVPIHSPATLRLERAGTRVPAEVQTGGDGQVDAILFYVPSAGSRWSATSVYWLISGSDPGARMSHRAARPAGTAPTGVGLEQRHFENQQVYGSAYLGLAGEVWFSDRIWTGGPNNSTISFTLERPAGSGSAQMTIRIVGGFDNTEHRVQLILNGTQIGTAVWSNRTVTEPTISFAGSLLRDGANTLELRIDPAAVKTYALLDWFEVQYNRVLAAPTGAVTFALEGNTTQDASIASLPGGTATVLDVTDPVAPVWLDGVARVGDTATFAARAGRYTVNVAPPQPQIAPWTPSTWKSPSNGADYIIVAHPSLVSAIEPLRAYHARSGKRTVVVTTQQIYDEFGDGTMDPAAIRAFVQYAYANWQAPRPAYLLLAGDATYDPLNFEGFGTPTLVPTVLGNYDLFIGETASDNAFATVDGADDVPDLLVGRLPASSPAELTVMVDKILAYNNAPRGSGEWTRKFFLTADAPDAAGNFYALTDNVVRDYFPDQTIVTRLFAGRDVGTSEQAQTRFKAEVAAGQAVVQYIGHAEKNRWGIRLPLYVTQNVSELANQQLPLFLDWTCWTGYFINPNPAYSGLSELTVRKSGGGSIAEIAPTGLDVATGHDAITRGVYDALFNRHEARVGQLLLAGKLNLLKTIPSYRRLVDTFLLFGDPALRLNLAGCLLFRADTNCDCHVDAGDLTRAAGAWHTTTGQPGYNPRLDYDGDGSITVADLSRASKEWGLSCQTD